MIKDKITMLTAAIVSLGILSIPVYAGTKTGPADTDCDQCPRYSVDDLITENDFEYDISYPWRVESCYPAEGFGEALNGKYNVTVLNSYSQERWGVQLHHTGLTLQKGHTYHVTFEVTADEDCKVYAKIGDAGEPYNEYWNNQWLPFTITKGEPLKVDQTFTMMSSTKDNCEMSFQLTGDCTANTIPYTVSFDNIHIYDSNFTEHLVPDPIDDNIIRVNQLGYIDNMKKTAIADIYSSEPVQWHLLDKSNKVVKSGTTTVKGYDSKSGDNIHEIDFSDYTTSGTDYKLEVYGSGTNCYNNNYSKSFDISIDGKEYENLTYDSLKYFYLNRSQDIVMPYCENCNLVRNSEYYDNDILSNKKDTWYNGNYKLDVSGGWLDSNLNTKNLPESSYALWMLQNKYEHALNYKNIGKYADNSLNIPESNNGYPDILDEGRGELESLLKMQVPEGNQYEGMVHHNVDVQHHSCGFRYLAPPSTAATLDFAAVAAQGSRIWNSYDEDFSNKCIESAEKAWKAALQYPDIKTVSNNDIALNNYGDDDLRDEFYFAACELYASTGKEEYLDYLKSSDYYLSMPDNVKRYSGEFISGNFDCTSVQGLGTLTLLASKNNLEASEIEKVKQNILKAADVLLDNENNNAYGIPITTDSNEKYTLNSNLYITNAAIVLAYAEDISSEDKYSEGIINALDYLLGKNPKNKSYVTGYGSNPVTKPYYENNIYMFSDYYYTLEEPEGIVPSGWIVNGVDSLVEDNALKSIGVKADKLAPALYYFDNPESFSTNKTGLSNNASFAWMLSYITDEPKDIPPYKSGDVNDDGAVNIKDYIKLQKYVLNAEDSINTYAADMDNNGIVDISDILLLKKYLLG